MLALLGDSVTTDHISPAGSIKPDSPAGRYLAEHGIERKDFNSYGSRRGNHEVMIRGTFANIRLRNRLLDGVEGGFTRELPRRRRADDDLRRRPGLRRGRRPARGARRQGVRLRVQPRLGGQGHGAARRPGRHRRELRADPPLEPHRDGRAAAAVPGGESRESLGLDGTETFSVSGITALNDGTDAAHRRGPRDRRDGREVAFDAVVRIDTPGEAEYYRNGGILPYVLRQLARS